MKPIKFKESNVVFAENQPGYMPFPLYKMDNKEGKLIGCWKLSFRERIKVLFAGRIWHGMWTFGVPLQPQLLTTKKSDVIAK